MASNSAFGNLLVQIQASAVGLQKTVTESKGYLKDLSKSAESMGDIVKSVFEFEAAKKGIEVIKSLSEAMSQLAEKGDRAGDISENFKALGGTTPAIEAASKAVLGTVSAFDLMKVANQGLIRTIPQFNEKFGELTEFAQRFAEATGRKTIDVLDELTNALAKGKAKGLEPFGFAIEKNASRAQAQIEVYKQLGSRIDELAPSIDSASKAEEAYKVALDDVFSKMGMSVNSNKDLTDAYRNLAEEVKKIDFTQLGTDLAELKATFINLTTSILPDFVAGLHDVALGLRSLFADSNNDATAKLANLGHQIEIQTSLMNKLKEVGGSQGSLDVFQKRINDMQAEYNGQLSLLKQFEANKKKLEQKAEEDKSASLKKIAAERADADAKVAKDTAAKKVQSLNDELAKINSQSTADQVKQNFEEALKQGNLSSAQDFLDKYKVAISDAADDAALKFKGGDQKAIEEFKNNFIAKAINPIESAFHDAVVNNIGKDFTDAIKTGNLAAAQDFLNQYKNAIDATSQEGKRKIDEMQIQLTKAFQDATKALMDGANEFVSSLTGLSSTLEQTFGVTIPSGMKKALETAQGILSIFENVVRLVESIDKITTAIDSLTGSSASGGGGGGLGGFGNLISGLFGGGGGGTPMINGVEAQGPSMANGAFVSNTGASTMSSVLGYGAAAYGVYNGVKGGAYTGVGSVGGALVGAYFGGPIGAGIGANLGGAIGGGIESLVGGHNEGMDQRRQVQAYLQAQLGKDINIGNSGAFNAGGAGWKVFDKLPQQSKTAFSAVGEQIKNILGLTQDIGPQIGAILATNIGDSAQSLKNVMNQLGISVQNISDSLIAAGKKGDKTWLEIEGSIESVEKAANAGKESVKAAITEIVTSGGRGQQALDGLRDSAIAAQKAGAKTLDDYRNQLLKNGMDPAKVDEIMKALKDRGVTSLQAIVDSSDRTAGAVISDITAMGFEFQNLTDQINQSTDAINNMAGAADGIAGGTVAGDGQTADAARSLTRMGAVTGIKSVKGNTASAMVVNIDASGSDAGVEHKIMTAMRSVEASAVNQALNAVHKQMSRGGYNR